MSKSESTPIPEAVCPKCGYFMDRATSAFGDYKPKPGDVTLCMNCAVLMSFQDDMSLQLKDESDLDSTTKLEVERVRKAIRQTTLGRCTIRPEEQ